MFSLWYVGSGTIAGPAKKLKALPKLFETMAIPVAIVRSSGGNQAAETAGGAENTTTPAIPFKMAQMWEEYVKSLGFFKTTLF